MKRGTVGIGLVIVTVAADMALAGGAVRLLPLQVRGGIAFEVTITIDPPTGTTAVGVEEEPPAGWHVIADISHGGSYDAGSHKIKWGPFFARSVPLQVSYTITPRPEAPRNECFTGFVSFDGFTESMQGASCVQVTQGIPTVSGWGLVILSLLLLTLGTMVADPGLGKDAWARRLHPASNRRPGSTDDCACF